MPNVPKRQKASTARGFVIKAPQSGHYLHDRGRFLRQALNVAPPRGLSPGAARERTRNLRHPNIQSRPKTRSAAERVSRRSALRAFGGLGSLVAGGGLLLPGCASLLGEETIEAHFTVGRGGKPQFYGWTEYHFGQKVDQDVGAELLHAHLQAPDGTTDLRVITRLRCEAVQPDGTRTPLASGSDFPENDTLAKLDILYDGNLRPLLFPDAETLRVEWTGTIDTAFPFPEGGIKIAARIIIEVL